VIRIAPIVEGHGEREAVRILIERIAVHNGLTEPLVVKRPIRKPRSTLLRSGGLESAVELAARTVAPDGAVLILIDSDDDCPAKLGPQLLARARHTRSDVPLAVVLAKHEFESWFLAAAESIRGRRGLAVDIVAPAEPEQIRGAKEWLDRYMTQGHTYSETLDQPALTTVFDLDAARRTGSFDKCCRDVVRLIQECSARQPREGCV
jgi:hypothetical protein